MKGITSWKKQDGSMSYRAEVRLKGYPRKSATFSRASEAMRWKEEVEYALKNNLPLPGEDIDHNDKYIEVAVDEYLLLKEKDKKRSRNTKRTDRDTGKRLIKAFGKKTIRTLVREDIEEHREDRLQIVGPSSVRQDMSMLNQIYEVARVKWRMRDLVNPVEKVKMPAEPPPRKKIVPEIRFESLFTECKKSKNKKLYPLVFLMLNTGMRPAEAALLRWEQVLLEENVIDLTETKTEPRRVPLTKKCARLLEGICGERKESDLIFVTEDIAKKADPSRYFRRAFEQACIRAKINKPKKRDLTPNQQKQFKSSHGKNVTLYSLRHSTATYLLMAGESLETVRNILGHKDISQTVKYVHISEEYMGKAANNPNLPWNK